jgi:hypothetical protein
MRLANYIIELEVPENTSETRLEAMCRALDLVDLRTLVERLLRVHLAGNRVLAGVRVLVEE